MLFQSIERNIIIFGAFYSNEYLISGFQYSHIYNVLEKSTDNAYSQGHSIS